MSVNELFTTHVKTVLSPMAGYTDAGFRSVCRDFGVGLTVTEMVSSKAIVMKNSLTKLLLKKQADDCPSAAQIFGHEPQVMADSVAIDEIKQYKAVDINMGCPVKKIVSNGDGSALMQNPKLASQIISAVKTSFKKNVTVKFRLGISDSTSVVDFAKMCADSGADMVTVHFRTAKQMYCGKADFTLLPDIAKAVRIPVIANGDISSRADYDRLTGMGAYGVAVGRAAVGRPYIFSEIAKLPYKFDLMQCLQKHIDIISQYYSPRVCVNEMKKHIAAYLKGVRNSRPVISCISNAKTMEEILQIVQNFAQSQEVAIRLSDN